MTTTKIKVGAKTSTIRNTRSNVSRWRHQIDGLPLEWPAFRKRFGRQGLASVMFKIAKGLAWLDKVHPGAADKGYLVVRQKAASLFLIPGTATWVADFGTGEQFKLNA